MDRSAYACRECGHLFRTPEGAARDDFQLMCPSCGSIDLVMTDVAPVAPIVMRATQPAATHKRWRRRRRTWV